MKSLAYIAILGLLMASIANLNEVDAVEDHIEVMFSARCDPHSEIITPTSITMQTQFGSTAAKATAVAVMTARGNGFYEATSTQPHWESPEKGWVAFLFEAPPISANYYCQTDWGNKSLHLSYQKTSDIRIHLSHDGNLSNTELDGSSTMNQSHVILEPTPGDTRYSAGSKTHNPYWLQIGIPVYNLKSSGTILENRFL